MKRALPSARGPALSLALLLLSGCGKGTAARRSSGSPAPGEGALASAAPLASSAPASSVNAVRLPDATCRALRVEGEAQLGAAQLASGTELDGSEWGRLAKGAKVTLKHSLSGREISLLGPAVFRACRRGREQVLLASGNVVVGSGMGARPGAEVLIATPVAAVRYADADFLLHLDAKRLSVEVRAGQVELDAGAATTASNKAFKSPLHAKDKVVVTLGKPDAAALMLRCKEAAEAAETSAHKVTDSAAPEPLGERAQAHVRARKTAREACAVATAATGLVADPAAAAGLWAEAVRWEGLWETIPRPSRGQAPEK
jgi:hypothetical protein